MIRGQESNSSTAMVKGQYIGRERETDRQTDRQTQRKGERRRERDIERTRQTESGQLNGRCHGDSIKI